MSIRRILMRIGGALGVAMLACGWVALQSARTARRELRPPRTRAARESVATELPGLEDARLSTSDGIELAAWYVPSVNGAAVVLGHGLGANRTQLLPQARALTQAGFGVLLLDWRAHGDSGGDLCTWGDHERRDVSVALDFLASRADVEPDRIGGLGLSMGSTSLIMGAARDPRLSSLMLEATSSSIEDGAALDPPRWGPISTWPALEVFRRAGVDVSAVRPIDVLGGFGPGKLLLVYGEKDPWVPPEMVQKMTKAVQAPEQVWVVPGAGHGDCWNVAGPLYSERMIAFFRGALLSPRP